MSLPDLVVRGRNVVTSGAVRPASIHIQNGVITAVAAHAEVPSGCPFFDAGDSVVMPGLVDTHVHINEPGRTEWEGFVAATQAAAAGGVTTLIEMPLNSIPPTTTVPAFAAKLAAAEGRLWADMGFWGGVVPGNVSELCALNEAGVFGFKCFLVPSGVEEFPHVEEADLERALPTLSCMEALLLVHAELPGPIEKAAAALGGTPRSRYSTWLDSRPQQAEDEAIGRMIRLCRKFGVRIHIVHVSSSSAVPLLRRAREEGLAVTAETCPHYLCFAAEEIPDGATLFKCAPPIRGRANREKLWAALAEGVIGQVATDHSPCSPEMKCSATGDFLRAWGGISSLELGLPAMWTEMRRRGSALPQLAGWMCGAPAALAGLAKRKGAVAVGCDADLVVWNPEATFRVDPAMLHHRHAMTPYDGRVLRGKVETTFLRGRKVYDRGGFPSGPVGAALKHW
jgi:allantoinase